MTAKAADMNFEKVTFVKEDNTVSRVSNMGVSMFRTA